MDEKTKYFAVKLAESEVINTRPKVYKYFGSTMQQHYTPKTKITFVDGLRDISCIDYLRSLGCEVKTGADCAFYITKVKGFYIEGWTDVYSFYPDEAREIDKEIFNYMLTEAIIIEKE